MQQPDLKSLLEKLNYLESQVKDLQRENNALIKENEQLRTFLKTIPQLVSFVDKNLTYQYVNEAYEKFFHSKAEVIRGKKVHELLGQKAFRDVKGHIEKVLSGKEVRYLTEINYINGTKHIEGHLFPQFNGDRTVAGYNAIHSDVTHHVENQQKLKESESRMRYFAAHAQDLMWSTDLDLNVTFINHYSKNLLGWEPEELMKLSVDKMFPFNTLRQVLPYYTQKLKEVKSGKKLKNPINLEVELLHKDGKHIWAELKADFVYNGDGKPIGVNGISRNIEARKKAEIKLKESEELFRLLLTNISDTVYLTDEKGRFQFVGQGKDVIFELEQNDILENESINRLFGLDLLSEFEKTEKDELRNIRLNILSRTGRRKKLLVNIKKVNIKKGKLLFSCRDITDLEKTRRALNIKEQEFDELEKKRNSQQQMMEKAEDLAKWGSWQWNFKDNSFVLSPGWRKIHDYHDDKVGFKDIEKIIHPEDLPKLKQELEKAIKNHGYGEVEVRVLKPGTSNIKYVRSTGKVILNEEGNPEKMIGYVRDLSEYRHTENNLRDNISKYRKIIDDAPVGIALLKQGSFAFANNATAAIYGCNDVSSLFRKDITDFIHEQDVEQVRKKISQFVPGKEPLDLSHRIITSGNTIKMLQVIVSGVTIEDETYLHTIIREQAFVNDFEIQHRDFFAKLLKKHPHLTQHELRHCACMVMNLSTKEIANIFDIQAGSIQKSRVRLKKKLKLNADEDLRTYLHKF